MKIINHFALLLLFGCAVSCTQPENSISNESIGIIPLPSTYELKPGTFYITGQSSIGIDKSDPEMTALANYFNEEISDATRLFPAGKQLRYDYFPVRRTQRTG